MTEERIRELLREMRDEPVPADSLARARARVEERTAPQPRRWWLVPLFAAVLAVLATVFWPYQPAQPVVQVAREAPVIAPPPTLAPKPVEVIAKPVRVARRIQKPAAEASTIRIETADPNVVLIFVTGGGGED